MVYDFLITLKKPDFRNVDLISKIMNIFALLVFAFYFYHYPKSGAAYLYFGIGIILSWLYTAITKRRKEHVYYRLSLFIGAVGWLLGPQKNIWMALLYGLAGLIEKQVKFPQEIGFSENEISFNSIPRRVLKWNEISNALIKDGLLTIDQTNNKLFQREIEGFVSADIENEFNAFCYRCIHVPKKEDLMPNNPS